MRQCIVCKREVPQGYERDHLQANHLGPHVWWFNCRQFQTMEPSISVAEIKRMADTNSGREIEDMNAMRTVRSLLRGLPASKTAVQIDKILANVLAAAGGDVPILTL